MSFKDIQSKLSESKDEDWLFLPESVDSGMLDLSYEFMISMLEIIDHSIDFDESENSTDREALFSRIYENLGKCETLELIYRHGTYYAGERMAPIQVAKNAAKERHKYPNALRLATAEIFRKDAERRILNPKEHWKTQEQAVNSLIKVVYEKFNEIRDKFLDESREGASNNEIKEEWDYDKVHLRIRSYLTSKTHPEVRLEYNKASAKEIKKSKENKY